MSTTTIETPTPARSIPSESDITASLEALGTTPVEIAQSLHLAGFKGVRASAGQCPVANFLKDAFTPDWVTVFHFAGLTFETSAPEDSVRVQVETTPAVREFIDLFDDGKFASLDATLTFGVID
jgi:hypothetical protein